MNNKIKKTLLSPFIAINACAIMAMNFCAYTCYLNPFHHPNASFWGLLFPVFIVINLLFIPFWLVVKRIITLLPITGMIICLWAVRTYCPINPFADNKGADLKFISYNVMMMGDSTCNNIPSENPILLYLLNQDADIICLQEARNIDRDDCVDSLKTVYKYYDYKASACNNMAVLSKHPIIEVIDLNDSTAKNRTFAYRIKVNEDTILVINNHFESFKLLPEDKDDYKEIIVNPKDTLTESRIETLLEKIIAANRKRSLQVDYLYGYIKNCNDKNIILCGDFNDSPISYAHVRLTDLLNDAYTRGGNGPGWSYNRSSMLFRIDHILVSDNISVCKTITDRSIDTSDHYPMISWLKITK